MPARVGRFNATNFQKKKKKIVCRNKCNVLYSGTSTSFYLFYFIFSMRIAIGLQRKQYNISLMVEVPYKPNKRKKCFWVFQIILLLHNIFIQVKNLAFYDLLTNFFSFYIRSLESNIENSSNFSKSYLYFLFFMLLCFFLNTDVIAFDLKSEWLEATGRRK